MSILAVRKVLEADFREDYVVSSQCYSKSVKANSQQVAHVFFAISLLESRNIKI